MQGVEEARRTLKENGVKNVLCFFSDIRGILQSFSIPVKEFTDGEAFETGIGFDGSSVRGFRPIDMSDMIWFPDPNTTVAVPWITDPIHKSAIIFGNILEAYGAPNGGRPSDVDPRGYVAERAKALAAEMGYSAVFGPEIEHFVFEGLDHTNLSHDFWASPSGGEGDSWGAPRVVPKSAEIAPGQHNIRPKEAYFRAPPEDSTHNYRTEVSHYLTQMGVTVEYHHHEVATCGQVEINYKAKEIIPCGDAFFLYKFVARNIAKKHGMMATFMPKPVFLDNASGMHTHMSLWKGEPFKGTNMFVDTNDELGLSQAARYFIGGLLDHSRALTAITCPTVNSYKRLVPGFEAPVNIAWSPRNRSALIRIPLYFRNHKSIRCEYRGCDPSCNPYLAFSALLAAGLDGIRRKIEPGSPILANIYSMSDAEKRRLGVTKLPTTLRESLEALASDEVLKNVLGSHIFDSFTELKENEWNQYCLYISPWEYMKYMDC